MTVRPATPDATLPELVLATRDAVLAEAEALRTALEEFSCNPQPACRFELDSAVWPRGSEPREQARAHLIDLMRHQAKLICANAYDHLITLGRSLGSDGAMPLYAHSTLSRVVCEAAVRLTWFLDPAAATSEERIMRGAASLLMSVNEQLKGVTRIPADHFHPDVLKPLVDNCTAERDAVHALLTQAGLDLEMSKDGKKVARLKLDSPVVSVPLHLEITEKMSQWLPDSPTWYNLSSGVTHSFYWMLRDAIAPLQDDADLTLQPNLMQVAAAGQCAISGSRLIIETIAEYYGHDPHLAGAPSRARRDALDPYMTRLAAA